MVLGGDDDHYSEDGAEDDGGDAHGQTDEGEVTGLTRRDLCSYHVPPRYSRPHLHSFDDGDDSRGPEAADGGEDGDG